MVGRRSRRSDDRRLMGNHQRCWLWGRHAVLESLRSSRWHPLLIRHTPALLPESAIAEVLRLCERWQIPLEQAEATHLERQCGRTDHQGLIAQMPEYPYLRAQDLIALCHESPEPCVLLLDRIQDPHNLGAILRSAEVLGIEGVFVPEREQSEINAQVVRSSAGAVHHLPIARVPSLTEVCRELQQHGFRLAAASEKSSQTVCQTNLRGPLGLMIGNEGQGPARELLELADLQLRIPQAGQISSLNAAVAAGIFCYEALRQRQSPLSPGPSP